MVAACREAKHVQSSHGCFDHILNLVVKNGINVVMAFKRLATATHKSTIYCERIWQECKDLENSIFKIHTFKRTFFSLVRLGEFFTFLTIFGGFEWFWAKLYLWIFCVFWQLLMEVRVKWVHVKESYSRFSISLTCNCNKQWMHCMQWIDTGKKCYKCVHKIIILRFSIFTIEILNFAVHISLKFNLIDGIYKTINKV